MPLTDTLQLISSLGSLLVTAALIVPAGFILGKIVGRLVGFLLAEFEADRFITDFPVRFSLEEFVAKASEYTFAGGGILFALSQLSLLPYVVIGVVSGIGLVLFILSVVESIDLSCNLVARARLWFRGQRLRLGSVVQLPNVNGKIGRFLVSAVIVKSSREEEYLVPYVALV